MNAEDSCRLIHALLTQLPIQREPSSMLPTDGLYFFYQEGEYCMHDGIVDTVSGRIVRIGNHPRSDRSLVRRLRQHYSGRKNGSVFRKYIGGSLLRRSNPDHPCLQPNPGKGHWEKQDAKVCNKCLPLEAEVSRLLREQFWFRCVNMNDRLERNRLEQGLIATVAACSICRPSTDWLGRYAYNKNVRESGLWNSDYVTYSQMLLDTEMQRFEQLIASTRG